jgi:hypothetical protein
MADVADTLPEWSATTANNGPSGATTIGTGLDDNLRECQGVVTRWLSHKGSDIASAATTDIGAVEGLMHDITGTATVTGFGTIRSGIWKVLKFEAAAILTHNATSLILPGAQNIVTADGDVGIFMSEGSGNWRCLHYMKAAGGVLGPVLGTEQATTSGTSIDFTNIPSWAKKIIIQFVGVSTSGTSNLIIQVGDSGGVEDTGYLGATTTLTNGAAIQTANPTNGYGLTAAVAATSVLHGQLTLTVEDAANFTWVASGSVGHSDAASVSCGAGSKSLSAALDRVRITTSGGTDTFDAGAINILYE